MRLGVDRPTSWGAIRLVLVTLFAVALAAVIGSWLGDVFPGGPFGALWQ